MLAFQLVYVSCFGVHEPMGFCFFSAALLYYLRNTQQEAAKDALKSCNSAKKDSFRGAWESGLQDNHHSATELVADQVLVRFVFLFVSFVCVWRHSFLFFFAW